MTHFKVEQNAMGPLLAAYPHDPEDRALSVRDYLEDKLSEGWLFETIYNSSGDLYFIFSVTAA